MSELEKKLSQINIISNPTQSLIIGEIHEIKEDIKMIKSHLLDGGYGSSPSKSKHSSQHQKVNIRSPSRNFYEERQTTQSSGGDEENIYNNGNGFGSNNQISHNNRLKSQGS
jgi:hypothetical protein